jgi:hypothetical protein
MMSWYGVIVLHPAKQVAGRFEDHCDESIAWLEP